MRRAFVGFSGPIGYSYRLQVDRTRNDLSDSPNPVLFGSMGLLTLYDEIWFACASLCPASMRKLPYVKFLDVHGPQIDLDNVGFDEEIEELLAKLPPTSFSINDMFENGFGGGITDYIGQELATDNHTHSLSFFNADTKGNPGAREVLQDVWLIERNKHLCFDLVLNPLTAKISFEGQPAGAVDRLQKIGLADRVLTLGSLYDITGPSGPYHPCIEEIRHDDLIEDFREWMDEKTNRLDNQDIEMIQEDVNARISDLTERSIRKYVERESLKSVLVKLTKDTILDAMPGGSAMMTIIEALSQNHKADNDRWKAFIALSQATLNRVS